LKIRFTLNDLFGSKDSEKSSVTEKLSRTSQIFQNFNVRENSWISAGQVTGQLLRQLINRRIALGFRKVDFP